MTQPVQEPTQGREDQGQNGRIRQLARRPSTAPILPIMVPYTPELILLSGGGGIVQPTLTSAVGYVTDPTTIHSFQVVNGWFTLGIDDPGTIGGTGFGEYIVTTGPTFPGVGFVFGGGSTYHLTTDNMVMRFPLSLIGDTDGFVVLMVPFANNPGISPGGNEGTNAMNPLYPMPLLTGSIINGYFSFPAA